MASTSGCSHQPKDLQLFNTSCTMGDLNIQLDFATTTHASEVDHATLSTSGFATTTPASEVDHATSSTSDFATVTLASEVDYATSSTLYFSAVEEQIKQSKVHWSTLTDPSKDTDEKEVDFEVSNKQEFEVLQRHPTWGGFFANFTDDGISTGFYDDHGELVVGKKFAEGAQAELYEAQIKWVDPMNAEIYRRLKIELVLKVFKEGTLLNHVKSQLPQGLLQYHVKSMNNCKSPTPKVLPYYNSRVHNGMLLKGGRFAFLMKKHHCDLRTLIERNMKLRSGEDCGPFSNEEAELTMHSVALGVNWLHNRDIVHKDLKASNVLVYEYGSGWPRWGCLVADYECSIGVVGTNFFRAPEILQACKERKVNDRPNVFLRALDVYSYGMICYEILTWKLPFEDHPLSDSLSLLIDLVINQHLRPEVPKYVDDWARELLGGCWQHDPTSRPRIEEILNVLSMNSLEVRRFEDLLKKTEFSEKLRS